MFNQNIKSLSELVDFALSSEETALHGGARPTRPIRPITPKPPVTTLVVGEESGSNPPTGATTMAIGEESTLPRPIVITTMMVGEEAGTTKV